MKLHKRVKKAFTILEIVIALAILAIGMTGILALYPVGFYASARAANMVQAATLGAQVLEAAKMLDYDNALLSAGNHTDILAGVDWQDTRFTYAYSVTVVDASLNLKQVTATVSWTERNNARSEQFATYITKYSP